MTALDEAGSCAICAMVSAPPTDGWAYDDEDWVAGTLAGLEIPGWIVLSLRRHAVETAPLTDGEAEGLGRAVGRLTAAIEQATGAERVYLQTYGERERHWHMLLSARGAEVPPEHRHTALFAHREKYIDVDDAELVLGRIRRIVATATDAQIAV